jgi:hypothetical protein
LTVLENDMNNQLLFKFLEEIRLHCRFGRFAFENIRSSVQGYDPEKTFFYVDALLSQARSVSSLLWPEREVSKARGAQLRSELKATDDSPLKMREWRKNFEASDEHFEDWIAAMEAPSYADFNIMPQGTMQGYKQDTFQRNLDPDSFQLVFRGQPCNLRQIANELQKIESTAQTWLKTHNPW